MSRRAPGERAARPQGRGGGHRTRRGAGPGPADAGLGGTGRPANAAEGAGARRVASDPAGRAPMGQACERARGGGAGRVGGRAGASRASLGGGTPGRRGRALERAAKGRHRSRGRGWASWAPAAQSGSPSPGPSGAFAGPPPRRLFGVGTVKPRPVGRPPLLRRARACLPGRAARRSRWREEGVGGGTAPRGDGGQGHGGALLRRPPGRASKYRARATHRQAYGRGRRRVPRAAGGGGGGRAPDGAAGSDAGWRAGAAGWAGAAGAGAGRGRERQARAGSAGGGVGGGGQSRAWAR